MARRLTTRSYPDVADRRLADVLVAEDAAQRAGLSPFERITCRVHRRWVHECIASPLHVVAVSGHRWCEECALPAVVSVDQLLGDVEVRCPQCRCVPASVATEQIVRTCQASLRAARDPVGSKAMPYVPTTRSA